MKNITIALLLAVSLLGAVTVTDSQGASTSWSHAELSAVPQEEFTTLRDKDGEAQLDTWQGFRFDLWLKSKLDKPFKVIRFESADRYRVSLSKAEFDTLACWLAFAHNGEPLPEEGLRIIFPQLRDMKWVRDLDRVALEDFDPLKMPARFEFLDQRLQRETLLQNPAPFTNAQGYHFADLLPKSSRVEEFRVVLYSRDGMKLSLEYPQHLEGAILEVRDEGFNLKSPRIPGGMWLKDIIYIQINDFALIHRDNLDALIALNRIMDWKLSPEVHFVVKKNNAEGRVRLNDLLADPEQLADVESFILIP
ncbi:MAG: hypothetical protein K0B87_06680 [Candidatus Syntrophosphaera sp.]|nr:hypothetical protein [Candidatus Syntrophosphaera sp.]